MHLILLGPPGAGKGTQAIALAERWQIPHISTGDILRQAIEDKTDLGIQARSHLEAGELVPDSLMMSLMRKRFAKPDMAKGWILDGFPRTLSQAKALDELLAIFQQPSPKVIYFEVTTGLLINRLMKMGRSDDTVDVIRRRIDIYQQETQPLIEYYQQRLCLTTINGNLPVAEVGHALSGLGEKETSGQASFIPSETEFDSLLAEAPLLVVDFTATWCGPCKLVAPLIDKLAGEYGNASAQTASAQGTNAQQPVNIFKLDLDNNQAVAKRYGVKGIPTVMFFKGGELQETLVGVQTYEAYSEVVSKLSS